MISVIVAGVTTKELESVGRPARPGALLVYQPAFARDLLREDLLRRIGAATNLLVDEPVTSFDAPEVDGLLDRVEILVTGWGCPALDGPTLDRVPRLRAAFHAAGSVKLHVTDECFRRGIRVTSAAAANAVPVAEFTVGAILLANKRAFRIQRRYRADRAYRLWADEMPGMGNLGKVVGIVGVSRVGRLVIERLRPFGFQILAYDPYLSESDAAAIGVEPTELDDLLARCDVASLHVPAVPATERMLDRRRLALLRDGAVLVNTARGGVVDMDALTAELISGRIDAVLDTTEPEILPVDSPLYDLDNVFLTPHIAGSLGAETPRMLELAVEELESFVRGEPLRHEVRREDWDRVA